MNNPVWFSQYPIALPDQQRRIVAYLDSVQARLVSLQELRSATGEEVRLWTLLRDLKATGTETKKIIL